MLTLKMQLTGKSGNLIGEHRLSYRLDGVTGEENKPWSKYTPEAHLVFVVTNEAAPELEPGEYLVTLTRVEAPTEEAQADTLPGDGSPAPAPADPEP